MVNREVNKRFHEITKALRKYGFGKFLNKTVKEKIIPSKDDEYEILLDTELPTNLRMMFQELGTSFIKLGQLLSTRPDMVGERIAKEFEQLQEDNPPVPYDEVKNFIENKKGSLLYYKNMLTSLLPLIAKAIHKIDNGDMKVKFELDGLDRIVSKFSLVVIIAALLISSSLVMTITRGPMLFDMPLIAVIGYVITLILSIIGIINYLYGR